MSLRARSASLLTSLAVPRGSLWDATLYLVLALLFYLPLALGIATFEAGDFHEHFLPFSQFLQQELLGGRWPLWNLNTYSDHPFLADIQAAVYYLPAYPFLLAGSVSGNAAGQLYWLQMEAIFHTALAGYGMHRLLLALTGRRSAAGMAGVAFMLSGWITGYAPLQLAILRSAVWLPFAFEAIWSALRQPRRLVVWPALAVFCALILLGGHPQTALYAAYALVIWLATALWQRGSAVRQSSGSHAGQWRAVLLGLLGAGLLTLGLAAGQLWLAWQFVDYDVRAARSYAELSGGLHLRDTWQLALPGVFSQFSPLYIGMSALVFAVAAMVGAWWGRTGNFAVLFNMGENGPAAAARVPTHSGRRVALAFMLIALFGLLASYGDHARLFPLLYRFAPGWDLFGGQERAAYLTAFSLAALAGLGVAWMPGAGRTLRKRTALLMGGAITVCVYGFGLLYQMLGHTAIGDFVYLWIAFYTLIFGLTACLVLWIDGWSTARSMLIVLLTALNLWVAGAGVSSEWVRPQGRVTVAREVVALASASDPAEGRSSLWYTVPGFDGFEIR